MGSMSSFASLFQVLKVIQSSEPPSTYLTVEALLATSVGSANVKDKAAQSPDVQEAAVCFQHWDASGHGNYVFHHATGQCIPSQSRLWPRCKGLNSSYCLQCTCKIISGQQRIWWLELRLEALVFRMQDENQVNNKALPSLGNVFRRKISIAH